MSDITFRSQQFAQGAQQWSEEMQGGYQQQGFAAVDRGMGNLNQGFDRLAQARQNRFQQGLAEQQMRMQQGATQQRMSMEQQRLQMEQEAAQVGIQLQQQRLMQAQVEAQNASTLMDLDIKAAQAKVASQQAEQAMLSTRKMREDMRAQLDPYDVDIQRGLATYTLRTGKMASISDGRVRESGNATKEQIEAAREVAARRDPFGMDMDMAAEDAPPLDESAQWVMREMDQYPAASNLRPQTKEKMARWLASSGERMMAAFDAASRDEAKKTGREAAAVPSKAEFISKILQEFESSPEARAELLRFLEGQ